MARYLGPVLAVSFGLGIMAIARLCEACAQ